MGLPAVAVPVAVSVAVALEEAVEVNMPVVSMMLMHFVVDGLHHRNWVSLDYVNGNFDKFHNRNLNDPLNGNWVVNRYFDHSLVGHLDDFLNRVRHRLVDLHVLDLDNWDGHFPDDRDLDGVGLRDGYLHGVGLRYGVRLGHAVGHFSQNFVGLVANAVFSRRSVTVSESMDLINDGGFGAIGRQVTTG